MGGECRSNASGFCSMATKPQLNNLVIENVTFTADADTKATWGGWNGEVDGGLSGIQNVSRAYARYTDLCPLLAKYYLAHYQVRTS